MATGDYNRSGDMRMVMHLIYEFKKGIRSLILCTLCPTCAELVKKRLESQGIGYLEQAAGSRNINLFFGESPCLQVVASFVHKPLHALTPEEDFMLGTMLGYDITRQCSRFCKRKRGEVSTAVC